MRLVEAQVDTIYNLKIRMEVDYSVENRINLDLYSDTIKYPQEKRSIILETKGEEYILEDSNNNLYSINKLRGKPVLAHTIVSNTVKDTLSPLEDIFKVDIYSFPNGEDLFVTNISEYPVPYSSLLIYYNKDFQIYRMVVIIGTSRFVYDSNLYRNKNKSFNLDYKQHPIYLKIQKDSIEYSNYVAKLYTRC
jgi:hypothetical protein